LHIRITLLSDVFATAGQAQGRAAIGLLQTLMSNTPFPVLNNLGSLHRASTWENIALNVGLSSKGIDTQSSPIPTPLEGSPNHTTTDLPSSDVPVAAIGPSGTNGAQSIDDFPSNPATSAVRSDGPRDWNASSLKHITQGLPNALAPFFQGDFPLPRDNSPINPSPLKAMVKMFHARRNPDPNQKKQITAASETVANIMLRHLSLNNFGMQYRFIF